MSNVVDQTSPGLRKRFTFKDGRKTVNLISWSPDGKYLASASDDATVNIWDLASGKLSRQLRHKYKIVCIAWSPEGNRIASGSDDGTITMWEINRAHAVWTATQESPVLQTGKQRALASIYSLSWSLHGKLAACASDGRAALWNAETGDFIRNIASPGIVIMSSAWSPDGKNLALGTANGLRLWSIELGKFKYTSTAYTTAINSVAWSPDGRAIACGSADSTIRICDGQSGQELTSIEGHAGAIYRVGFSYNGHILASKSKDNFVRLWKRNSWEPLTQFEETAHDFAGLEFHPRDFLLATVDQRDTSIRIWEVDEEALFEIAASMPSRHYANAKVVLVGDSGVGKSGLGLVLSGKKFVPTESTHGRHVWEFQNQELELDSGQRESRQILLWDLAGQPGYRLIHQLHLNEVAIALIVFDARSETDPLSGVRHWDRSLRQARLLEGTDALPIRKFLVAARVDRGGISVSKSRIDAFLENFHFDHYFETSAKEGWNITELADAIRAEIAWDVLPRVSSTDLFQHIKKYLIDEKDLGRLLSTVDELYRGFLKTQAALSDDSQLKMQFETCIGLLESRGLIQRLTFGNLVLLQPEILDAYASAIVDAAKDEPDGLGSIPEETVRKGQFRLAKDERIRDQEKEGLLLIATVEALLKHEIALREQTNQGPLLVFPSQLTRENPALPDPEGKSVIFTFEGPLINIYATLAVRLSHSNVFQKKEMWRNAATYQAATGGTCGVFLRELEEGRGELTLFFDPDADNETRIQFEEFVYKHLQRRSLPETLDRRRIFICPSCNTPVSELQAKRRVERGFSWIECNVCEHIVELVNHDKKSAGEGSRTTDQMDGFADSRRIHEAAVSTLQGKSETGDYDVLLLHQDEDSDSVRRIASLLRDEGLLPWLAEWEVRPGTSFQESIDRSIKKIKSVAVFVGPSGLAPWSDGGVRAMLRSFAERQVPIIPVVLDETAHLPALPIFFERLSWVDFRRGETPAIERLVWGITGERSRSR